MLKFDIANVVSFRGFDVVNGEISLSVDEYREFLDEVYGLVNVCGYEYSAGQTLLEVDPVAFRVGKGDYESSIQSELEDQLENLDDTDIEFEDDDLPESADDTEDEE